MRWWNVATAPPSCGAVFIPVGDALLAEYRPPFASCVLLPYMIGLSINNCIFPAAKSEAVRSKPTAEILVSDCAFNLRMTMDFMSSIDKQKGKVHRPGTRVCEPRVRKDERLSRSRKLHHD